MMKYLICILKVSFILTSFQFSIIIFKVQPCIILKNGVLVVINGHAGKTAQIQQSQFDRVAYKIEYLETFIDNIVITYSTETK
jgi:hypothetical protein